MESTREERMQQRLRGAQRQVKDVDFGFMFPAFQAAPEPAEPPAAPAPAPTAAVVQSSIAEVPQNSATPQPDLPLQLSTHTPLNVRKSRSKSPNTHGLQSNKGLRSNSRNDANTSAKRRKLDTDEPPSSSTRSMRSSRTSARQDIYAIPDDDEGLEQSAIAESNATFTEEVSEDVEMSMAGPQSQGLHTQPTASQGGSFHDIDDTTGEYDQSKNGNISIQEESVIAAEQTETIEEVVESIQNNLERGEPISEPSPLAQSSGIEVESFDITNDAVEDVSPPQPRRSRRRSSQEKLTNDSTSNFEDSMEQAEAIDDYEAATRLKKNRGRRVSRHIVRSDSPAAEEPPARSAISMKKRGRVRQVTSPVQQRQPAPSKTKPPQNPDKGNKKRKVREGSPIPVTVHRLEGGLMYDEDDEDADILNSEIPCAKRTGVNAVDVLSQICQELVTAGLETLGDNLIKTQDAALRLEYKTKIRAVEGFGKELQVRLLEHTINLDNAYSLEKRIREGQKKKIYLREEILRVRAEREKVALRMDEIRIAHEKESNEAQQQESLNTTVHDIELALDRGKTSSTDDDRKPNMELRLKKLADEASSGSDSGGILKQIKDFNAFMERTALALERRKAI